MKKYKKQMNLVEESNININNNDENIIQNEIEPEEQESSDDNNS